MNIRHLGRRIAELVRQAMRLIEEAEHLCASYNRLTSVSGIACKNAVLLLGELAMLPEVMSVREWVAHAGLDPCRHQSGTSVEKKERISKVGNARIRRALKGAPVVHAGADGHPLRGPRVGAFYEKLLAKGKPPMVAVVAVMRKLLHAIYGMFKAGQDFDGEKFYATPEKVPAAA